MKKSFGVPFWAIVSLSVIVLSNLLTVDSMAYYSVAKNIAATPKQPVDLTLTKDQLLAAKKTDFPQGSVIRYDGWRVWDGWKSGSLISSDIKTDYMDDPIYMSMKLPSEVTTMRHLPNGFVIDYKPEGCIDALGMGAIYCVEGETLPETFNIYIGKLATYVLYEGATKWETLDSHDVLDDMYYYSFFKLPVGGSIRRATENEYTITDSYVKFTFKRSDFDNANFHFWGLQKPALSQNIAGLVSIYEVWTDTPEAVGKLAAAIGNDQRDSNGGVHQTFTGRTYKVTTEKRLIIGHNIPDTLYDTCVSKGYSPKVCYDLFVNK